MSNIKADVVQHGQKTVYRFHVVATEGPNKGQVTEAFNTADRATAQKWLEQKKAEDAASLASDPGSSPGTVNGEPLATSERICSRRPERRQKANKKISLVQEGPRLL